MPHVLAQQDPARAYSPRQRQAVREWAALTGAVLVGLLLLVMLVSLLLRRQRRLILAGKRPRRRRRGRPRDAWSESGKRLPLAPRGAGADDDTVDIDPDDGPDLGPGDVKGPRA
jgi:hypothetical protein